ncbi:MAG: lecithin retinol acyltransferase family protein [Myxococcales bacterium]|nr:lecithin retinol acyltransferase family protein [Myxococcales bacterium]
MFPAQPRFLPGDRIWTPARPPLHYVGINHYGIYVGPIGPNREDVIHCSKRKGEVVWDYLADFEEGKPAQLEERAPPELVQKVVVAAIALLGSEYDLFSLNCEQFANLVQKGVNESPQLRAWFVRGLAALGGIGAGALLAKAVSAWTEGRPPERLRVPGARTHPSARRPRTRRTLASTPSSSRTSGRRCRKTLPDGRQCSSRALPGNYGFCGRHR